MNIPLIGWFIVPITPRAPGRPRRLAGPVLIGFAKNELKVLFISMFFQTKHYSCSNLLVLIFFIILSNFNYFFKIINKNTHQYAPLDLFLQDSFALRLLLFCLLHTDIFSYPSLHRPSLLLRQFLKPGFWSEINNTNIYKIIFIKIVNYLYY